MSGRRNLWGAVRRQLVGLVHNPDIQMIRDLIYLGLGQIGVKLVGFIVYAYLARILSAADYGALETILAVVGMLTILVDFGLGAAGLRYRALYAGQPEAEEVIGVVTALRVILAVLSSAGLMIGVALLMPDPRMLMLASFLALSLVMTAWGGEWLLQSLEKMRDVAIAQFLRTAFLALGVLLLVRDTGDLAWFGLAEALSVLLTVAYMIHALRRAGARLSLSLRPEVLKPLVRLATPLGTNALMWGAAQSMPVVIVGALAGLESAAWFATAQRLVTSVQSLSHIYHFNMYPTLIRLYIEGPEAMVKLSLASLRVVAWACIGPSILVAFHAGGVMALLFGPSFHEAGPVLAILIFAIPIHLLSGHHRWPLTAAGQNGQVLIAGVVGLVVAVGGCIVLTYFMGAEGGALAVVLSTLTIWIMAAVYCARGGFGIPILRRVSVPLGAGLLAGAATVIFPYGVAFELITFVTIYVLLGLIVDQRRIYADLRHLAYAKKIRRSVPDVVD